VPAGGAGPAAPWYTFSTGLVTVVVFSTEHNVSTGSPQGEWLARALAAVDRRATPWLVTSGHRSMYVDGASTSTAWASDLSAQAYLRGALEPLFARFAVDVHFSGHTHVTQRHCAARGGACAGNASVDADGAALYAAPAAPVFFSLGSNGANVDASGPARGSPFTLWATPGFGYGVLTALSPSLLEVRIVDPVGGAVIDVARITQPARAAGGGGGGGGGGSGGAAAGALDAGAAASIALAALAVAASAAFACRAAALRAKWAVLETPTGAPAAAPEEAW